MNCCKMNGCPKPVKARQMCKTHYEFWLSITPQQERSPGVYAQNRLKSMSREELTHLVEVHDGNLTSLAKHLEMKLQQLKTFKSNNSWFKEIVDNAKAAYYTPEKNRERDALSRANWKKNNPEKVREINRRWAKNQDPEKRALWNNYNRQRRLEIVSVDVMSKDSLDYCKIIRNDPCVWCGSNDTLNEIDHIRPLVSGGSNQWNNFSPTCRSCNSSKGSRTLLQHLMKDGLKEVSL